MPLFSFTKKTPAPVVYPAELGAPVAGDFVPMSELKDEAFSGGALGQCIGVKPADGNICAPIDGVVSEVTETAHALVIQAGEIEILIHAGVHTVNMKGEGFKSHVKLGQVVRRGENVLTMDLWKVRNAGYDDTVIMAVSNSKDFAKVESIFTGKKVNAGDGVLKVSK
ncbi:MAG: PTS glucose transporter subunit IIA [Synergistaceae bacterium]|nr:PTS glucose transporter subunit IIA [Synergistaceae bacterium]